VRWPLREPAGSGLDDFPGKEELRMPTDLRLLQAGGAAGFDAEGNCGGATRPGCYYSPSLVRGKVDVLMLDGFFPLTFNVIGECWRLSGRKAQSVSPSVSLWLALSPPLPL
jgi:hypothetical protein